VNEKAERRAEVVRDAEDRLVEIGLGAELSVQGPGDRSLTFRRHKKVKLLMYGPAGYQCPLVEIGDAKEQKAGIALIPALEALHETEAAKLALKIGEVVDNVQATIRRERENWRR
jgi:hypothetical protein